jgi:hypothetical protein
MCEPYDPFDFPDLPDEAVVAIDSFLIEFLTHFEDHYLQQMIRYHHHRPEKSSSYSQLLLPLSDPPF